MRLSRAEKCTDGATSLIALSTASPVCGGGISVGDRHGDVVCVSGGSESKLSV